MTSPDSFAESTEPHAGDQIEAYLAGGLSAGERAEFEAHVAGCTGCAELLDQAGKADSALAELFAAARPGLGFEDRLIGRLRTVPAPRGHGRLAPVKRLLLHPTVRRAAIGVAAAVVLAAVGRAAKSGLDRQTLPGMRHGKQFADLWGKRVQERSLSSPRVDDSGSMQRPDSQVRQFGARFAIPGSTDGEAAPMTRQHRMDVAVTGPFQPFYKPTGGASVAIAKGTDGTVGAYDDILRYPTDWPEVSKADPDKPPAAALGTTTLANGSQVFSYYTLGPSTSVPGSIGNTAASLATSGAAVANGSGTSSVSSVHPTNIDLSGLQDYRFNHVLPVTGKPAEAAVSLGGGAVNVNGRALQTEGVVAGTGRVNYGSLGDTLGIPADKQAPGVALSTDKAKKLDGAAGSGAASPVAPGFDGGFKPSDVAARASGNVLGDGKHGEMGQLPAAHSELAGAVKDAVTRVYDVRDLIANVPDFSDSPKFDLASSSGAAKGDGGGAVGGGGARGLFGNGGAGTAADSGKTREQMAEDITKLVQETVASDSWKDTGGDDRAVKEVSGQLVVTQTPENQRRVAEVLQQLRETRNGEGVEKGNAAAPGAKPGDDTTKGKPDAAAVELKPDAVAADAKPAVPAPEAKAGDPAAPGAKPTDAVAIVAAPGEKPADAGANVPAPGAKPADAAGDAPAPGAKPADAGANVPAPGAKPADAGANVPAPGAKPADAAANAPAPGAKPADTPANVAAPGAKPQAAERPAATPAELQAQAMKRQIIRNGEMIFDVDSFDSSMMLVGKIAGEEGGFIATTDSEKLPNGKVKGSVIVRCPPDRLDTLVLKLRGLGDLKSQRIAAQDITKQYTDIESQLRAAHAMEDRLLEIIKDGKGAIKDLLEAEKQLGVWREKLEALEGEIRYYDNLVALSTLTVTLMERDIKTPYATAQTEQVTMSVVAEDVEKARGEAISQIEAAKGRIVESDLQKHEAAQFSATVVADVPPDAADPLIDRLKQIGQVSGLSRERKQTSEGGTGAPPPGLKIERQDTRVQLSIFNLANVTPRTITSLNLAADDVEKSYNSIIAQVKAGGGRIVESQLIRPKAEQVTGTIKFDVPAEKADVLSAAIRAGVEVTRLDVNENKDLQNVTDAKRGFVLMVYALASITPRETTTLKIASKDVPAAFNKLLESARTSGRVSTSQLNEQNVADITGTLEFDVPRADLAKIDAALHEAGVTVTRNVSRSPDSENTVDSKVRLNVTLVDEINLASRQTITQSVAARNVPEAFNKLADALHDAGARVFTSQLADQDKPTVNAQISFSIPREDAAKAEAALHDAGETVDRNVARSPDLQNTVDTKVSYRVKVVDQRSLQPRETVSELVAVRDVPGRYNRVLDTLRLLDAQVYSSQLNEQNKNEVSAELEFAIRRDAANAKDLATVEKALGEASDIFGRTVVRSQDEVNTVDTKVRFRVTMRDADTQPPRQTYTMEAEGTDVDRALADLEAAGIAVGGRAVDSTPSTSRNDKGEPTGHIILDVPLARAEDIVNAVRDKGHVTATRRSRDDRVPEGDLSRARIDVTVSTGAIMAGEGSLWDPIKSGLRTSGAGLLFALQFVIIGICLIGPFAVVIWGGIKLLRWSRRKPAAKTAGGPSSGSTPPAGPPGPAPAIG